jgi:hypothetical protein
VKSKTHRRLKLARLPTSLAATLAALPSISEIPSLDSGTSSIDYRLMSNVSREKSFNFGCVIRFTLQCSSSRLSETSGQYESEITIALLRRNTAISSSGFGSARKKTTTTAVALAAELFGSVSPQPPIAAGLSLLRCFTFYLGNPVPLLSP